MENPQGTGFPYSQKVLVIKYIFIIICDYYGHGYWLLVSGYWFLIDNYKWAGPGAN